MQLEDKLTSRFDTSKQLASKFNLSISVSSFIVKVDVPN